MHLYSSTVKVYLRLSMWESRMCSCGWAALPYLLNLDARICLESADVRISCQKFLISHLYFLQATFGGQSVIGPQAHIEIISVCVFMCVRVCVCQSVTVPVLIFGTNFFRYRLRNLFLVPNFSGSGTTWQGRWENYFGRWGNYVGRWENYYGR